MTEHIYLGWEDEMVTPVVKQLYFSNIMCFAFDLRIICPANRWEQTKLNDSIIFWCFLCIACSSEIESTSLVSIFCIVSVGKVH